MSRGLITARNLVLSLAGIATVPGLIVLAILDAPEVRGQAVPAAQPINQTPPIYPPLAKMARKQAAPARTFEVATVKSSPPTAAGELISINLGTFRNGRLTFTNASLSDCLKFAYGIVSDAQISGPDWIKSKAVRFDIVALAPPDTPPAQLQLMLQALLADRLKVVLHHEQKEISYLALTADKNGPKIREVMPDPASPGNTTAAPGRIVSSQMSMERLATLLSRFQRATVLDLTGLKGLFEVKLEWTPDDSRPPVNGGAAPAASDVPAGPSIFAALQEQLGLRLEAQKGPLDVVVIDQAEKVPTEN
jgi:uncharacterized protein (TIGR03435 family)